MGGVWERVGKTWCLTRSPRNHELPWHGTKGWNPNTRDFFPCEYFVLLVNLFSLLYSFEIGTLRSSVVWWFWCGEGQRKAARISDQHYLGWMFAWGQPWVVVKLFCCLLQGFDFEAWKDVIFFISMGRVDFSIVPFPISHLRETVIHSWAANSMGVHHILWLSFAGFSFHPGTSPTTYGYRPAYLRPQTPAAWRISRSQPLKKPKLAWTPTLHWYDKSQHACQNLLTILVWLDHK